MSTEAPSTRELDALRERADRFIADLDEEYYLHFSGQKESLDVEQVYERYEDLTRLETAKQMEGAPAELWRFACEGYLGNLTREHQARIARERRFATDAAHELRTPLAAIVASSQLLPDGRAATIVRDGVGKLRRLVDQLLELARLEGGLDAIEVDQVDLQHVALAAQAIYPSVVVDAPSASHVATDLRRLERIVANLVENALRHGSPPVTIHVDGHSLAVSDRGPGFDADLIPHVTDRFTVGDAARSQGVGLGLSITAEHARALHARLEIANRPDGGAIVTVTLTDLRDAGIDGRS